MTKKDWIEHMGSEFLLLDVTSRAVVKSNHLYNNCPECKSRLKTIKKERAKKDREYAMESVGLTKCKVNGKVFWE